MNIEPFLQYGVLGIIAFIFIKNATKQNETQNNNFVLLIKELITERKDTFDNFKNSLNTIIQTIIKQNNEVLMRFQDLETKINKMNEEKQNFLDFFIKTQDIINKSNIELNKIVDDLEDEIKKINK